MTQLLVSVRDNVASSFFPPFVAPNEAAAIRQLINARQQPGPLKDNPQDYSFFVVGNIDFETGIVTGLPHKALTVPLIKVEGPNA